MQRRSCRHLKSGWRRALGVKRGLSAQLACWHSVSHGKNQGRVPAERHRPFGHGKRGRRSVRPTKSGSQGKGNHPNPLEQLAKRLPKSRRKNTENRDTHRETGRDRERDRETERDANIKSIPFHRQTLVISLDSQPNPVATWPHSGQNQAQTLPREKNVEKTHRSPHQIARRPRVPAQPCGLVANWLIQPAPCSMHRFAFC
jgi:hypothetical protein